MKKFYVLMIWGYIKPNLYGPYASMEERDEIAMDLYKEHGLNATLFKSNIVNGELSVHPYDEEVLKQNIDQE